MRRFLLGVLWLAALGCGRAEIFRAAPAQTGVGGGSGGGGGGGEAGGGVGGSGEVSLHLTENGGCGDAFFYAMNPEKAVMVTVYWPNRIHTNPPISSMTFPVAAPPTEAPQVQFHRGKLLSSYACTDLIEPGSTETHGALISGTVRVEIGIGKDSGAFGTMNLDHAVFIDPAGGQVSLTPLQVGPVYIGWLPG